MISVSELKDRINQGVRRKEKFLFAIDFEMTKGVFIPNPESCEDILWRVDNNSNFTPSESLPIELNPQFITINDYEERFRKIYSGIQRGDSFLTNLTIKTHLGKEIPIEQIALSAKSRYMLYVPNLFVSFSPEPFIKVSAEGVISSYPMKGTIRADVKDAEKVILNDYKESAEHSTIVDLIRSDLSRVANCVEVESFKYLEKLSTNNGEILQMSSKICGKLLPQYADNYGDMLFEMLPAGSISGAPKHSTIRLIESAEGESRGFYCGVFGYFDGKSLDSSVMIRYIEKSNGEYYFRSGGGVTINSNMLSEYEEVKTKVYITR